MNIKELEEAVYAAEDCQILQKGESGKELDTLLSSAKTLLRLMKAIKASDARLLKACHNKQAGTGYIITTWRDVDIAAAPDCLGGLFDE